MTTEKSIYKVIAVRDSDTHGTYDFANKSFEEEFDNYEEAKDYYDSLIDTFPEDEYFEWLLGKYPYETFRLMKDDEELESETLEIKQEQYAGLPEFLDELESENI